MKFKYKQVLFTCEYFCFEVSGLLADYVFFLHFVVNRVAKVVFQIETMQSETRQAHEKHFFL